MKCTIKWNKENINKLEGTPDKILYFMARKTLDMTIPHTPRDTGIMREATSGFRGQGVVKTTNGYELGSDTYYASDVYLYDDNTTNWTTPGTYSHWFARTWRDKQSILKQMAINHYRLK